MPLPINSQYPPPKSWEEFEDLCADLYALIWSDPGTQKHGRQGQAQAGVDVYGKADGTNYTGVQCKKKSIWPPTELTTDEIGEEVEKAKTWKPGLKQFIIATTAPNDHIAQEHARQITAAHKRRRLFTVDIASWDEITRRLANYPQLLQKYGYAPDAGTVTLVVAEVLKQAAPQLELDARVKARTPISDAGPGVADALERDLAARYVRALKRSFFPETTQIDEFVSVADIAQEPAYSSAASDLRRRILLRAARGEAVGGSVDKANELLSVAQKLKGADSDLIARARILERSDVDGALALLRDEKDSDSRSTVFNILVRHKGATVGLKWLADEKIGVTDLTVNGLQTLVTAYLSSANFDELRPLLLQITPDQLSEGPYFRFLRAMVNVASILPIPDRELAVRSFQMDARRGTRSIHDEATTASRLDLAIDDLTTLLPLTSELGLPNAKRIAETYIRWCELLHPYRKVSGLAHLQADLSDSKLARERLSLAFAFDPQFKPDAIDAYLARREQIGGLDDDDLKAALVARIHSNDPASVAAIISRYRARFEANYQDPPIFTIELQALALAGETSSARLLLEKHRADLTPEGILLFETLISKSEGKDPVAEDLKAYEATQSLDALRALVGSLVSRKDHRASAKYAEELFAKSSDPRDIATAAYEYAQLGDGREFTRLIEAHPFLEDREPEFCRHYAWELFRLGKLKDAKARAELLAQNFPANRDLQLEIAIAIESGEWETLAKPLAAFLDDVSKHTGLQLIRAAHIAQQSGQGPMLDLMYAAVSRADNDPHVWLGAYSLVVEEGLEDDVPDAHLWFRKALALSDKQGTVQQFELKELIPQQIEWNKRTQNISELITRAEVPLVIAAPGLRTTLVDILLRNLVRNVGLDDARRKYVLPLFSGHRVPSRVDDTFQCLALDVSSLLVLGWLGLLPNVLKGFKQVTLPATVLTELFEGRRRVQQVQKSRIKRAQELEQALSRKHLKVARLVERTDDQLSIEVGPSLASLIRAAEASGGILVRPAPVHRPGLEQIVADVTNVLPNLSDMHTLLKVLSDHGAVDQTAEQTAKQYFDLQDKALPGCGVPDPSKPLFIDGLALVYLQYTNLLGAVLKVFKDVRIEGSSEDEALAIIGHGEHVQEVLRVIDDVRNTVRTASSAGQLSFGPRRSEDTTDDQTPSTLHLLSDLTGIDALVCDDRALNKENVAADNKGRRIPCLTTLDVLEELRARNKLTDTEWQAARHKLRIGGASLVPVTTAEVVHAARRSRTARSAEMRAIQESINLARVADVPSFPREVQWFASASIAIKSAVMEIWKSESDPAIAARLSNLILSSVPRPDDWKHRWEPTPPEGWVEAVDRAVVASLAIPIELSDDAIVQSYNAWLEKDVLEPMRTLSPERYQAIINYIRTFVLSSKEDSNEEEKTTAAKPKSKPRKTSRKALNKRSASKKRSKAKS
jgi:hypothetical protein